MNLTESVYKLAENFMKKPEYVWLNNLRIESVAKEMKEKGPPNFPIPKIDDIGKGILLELIGSSVNYCYWYGKSNIRPLDANSTKMYNLLMAAFKNYTFDTNIPNFSWCIKRFITSLIKNRFPLIEERNRHLEELVKEDKALDFVDNLLVYKDIRTVQGLMSDLIISFPGFASDLFLKRASLFFIQLFRRFGWFSEELNSLHVPADYQVPKILNYYGCTSYDDQLESMIFNSQLIPTGSLIECEIRSATILVIKRLCELTGWNVAEVDGYFFLKRHECKGNFHLTITTDY